MIIKRGTKYDQKGMGYTQHNLKHKKETSHTKIQPGTQKGNE